MSDLHPVHQEYAGLLDSGQPGVIDLGRTVLCDNDSADLTDDSRSGGFLFGSYAIGPCCAEKYLATIKGYGEEHLIRSRCPEGVSFADWVRSMRTGPGGNEIRVSNFRGQA
jgi:hypothetical protein